MHKTLAYSPAQKITVCLSRPFYRFLHTAAENSKKFAQLNAMGATDAADFIL